MNEIALKTRLVHLHRNSNQKQFIFAFQIEPVIAANLIENVAIYRIITVHFCVQILGQYWMQINTWDEISPTASRLGTVNQAYG